MTSATVDVRELPIQGKGRSDPGWWAMVWTIATEAMLFAFLLFSFYYIGSMARSAWPPSGPLSLKLSLPNTIILIVSSIFMWLAERGIERGSHTQLRAFLAITFLLGLAFAIIQGFEWRAQPFRPTTGVFGSLFYTITGFHGAHVIVGLIMNLFVQMRAWFGGFTRERHLAVTNAAMYWHFVDVVWLFVFISLYISPRVAY